MNNIYKVIWSKAKNCYVVASEIARSHTKSASGSEKIGGVTRRSLLASLMALSLLCGGLGVAEAAVRVNDDTSGAYEVLTKQEVTDELDKKVSTEVADLKYAKTSDVYTRTDANEKFATKTELGSYAKSTDVYSKTDADDKFATNDALNDLKDTVNGKADKSYVDTEVGEVDGKLANKADKATTLVGYGITDAYTREKTDELLNTKANAADVYTRGDIDTKLADVYSKTEVDGKITDEENARNIAIQNAINGEAENRKNAIDVAIAKEVADRNQAIKIEVDKEANARDTAIANAKNDLQTKITEEETAREALDTRLTKAEDKITANETAIDNLKTKDTENVKYDNATVKDQITLGGAGGTKITNLKDADLSDSSSDAVTGKQLNKTNKDLKTEAQTRQEMDTLLSNRADALEKNTGGITRNDTKDETYIEKNVTVDNQGSITAKGKVTANGGVDAGAGAITTTGAVNAGSLNVTDASYLKGDVTMDNKLSVTGDTSLGKTDVGGALNVTGASNLQDNVILGMNAANTVTVNGKSDFKAAVEMDKGLTVTGGDTTLQKTDVKGALSVTGESSLKNTTVGGTLGVTGATTLSGELTAEKNATFEKDVTVRNDLTVDGKLNVGEISMKNNELKNGKKHDSATTITADEISNLAKVTEQGNTTESQFTHNEKGTFNHARDGNNADWKESNSNVTADGVSNKMTDSDGNRHTYYQTAAETKEQLVNGDKSNFEKKTAKGNTISITEKDADGNLKSSLTNTQTVNGEKTSVTNKDSSSTINQGADQIRYNVTSKDANKTSSSIEVKADGITNTSKDGTITNDAKDIVNNATGDMTNNVGGKLTTTVKELATENFNGGLDTNVTGTENHTVTGDQNIHVTKNQTNQIDGNQENTIGGNQTTTVTGDISNKAENITNEANTKLTDKVGENTRVLDSEGITDTVGGSTFKQRIDKIMMESKDVSIKAEETLTNEAKVITNKASEVINNEAVNINNTATGIIKSKASEIQNQADKLISNKVGENTWENMENGKITTSIKDGAKQNLTQSDAAGTTQSTVDGGKSTVTIQNADGLADAVTDGTNTSVQNQTASAIAAAVKDGAGNENASVANATTSVNTIKSGSKANTVISTADGTSFINSEAAAPVGDGAEVKTTIKGNTITTGKVTMDYAEVMKDLGVRGNANITGKTTTGSLEVTGTSTLKGDVTMGSNATVKKDLTVEGNTNLKNTKVDGTLDVTQKATFGDSVSIAKDLSVDGNATIKGDVTAKSYKVGDKTYISAAGINANDQKITNVADGSISEGSKDAVNGGQLYGVKNDLEGKVNKVGANAAAMANLHPMEFDPDSKWNIAAAIGNYGSETAAALGAFYRPNDDVMVNLSTAFGTGENMVGGGVSVRLGKGGNKLSREENNALKDQVNDLTARMNALLSVLNPNMSKDFPDVPENHWAYEAVSRLAGNDIVQGYPDGEFHGERTMTRYEMAEIIYNALSRGAEAEKELVEEFKPELQAMAASEKATAERAEG